MSDIMIQADRLSKYYGDFATTADVSFSISRGKVDDDHLSVTHE